MTLPTRRGLREAIGRESASRAPTPGVPARAVRGAGLRLFALTALGPSPHGRENTEAGAVGDADVGGTSRVVFRDVAAIVTPAPYAAEPLTLPELEAYGAVIDALCAAHAVLPAPPGTVFRGREALVEWLELHYFTLIEALDFVDGRVVARVTARGLHDGALRPASLRLTPTSFTAEHEVADLAVADVADRAAEAFAVLRRESVSSVVLRAIEGAPDDGSVHASFLVERPRLAAFEQAVAREGARRPGLRLACTGPWPPYDFVRLQFGA